jgi:hypothetical protein
MKGTSSEAPAGSAGAPTRRIRGLAFGLMSLALAFYFGFIAITIYRSHH